MKAAVNISREGNIVTIVYVCENEEEAKQIEELVTQVSLENKDTDIESVH
jgi:hypothetical protein